MLSGLRAGPYPKQCRPLLSVPPLFVGGGCGRLCLDSLVKRHWQEAGWWIQALWDLRCSTRAWKQVTGSLACSWSWGWWGSPWNGEGLEGDPGSGRRSSSGGKATGWSWGQGRSVLLLLPAPGERRLGLGSLCILLLTAGPSCTSRQVFVVLYSFFVFFSWGDVCPGVRSDDKASTYNAGDPGSIPGLGRSPGEGNGNPL